MKGNNREIEAVGWPNRKLIAATVLQSPSVLSWAVKTGLIAAVKTCVQTDALVNMSSQSIPRHLAHNTTVL